MNFNQAFDITLKKFGISAKWLAEQSGVAPQIISDFRRGKKSIQTDSLGKLLDALSQDAKMHFFSSLLEEGIVAERLIAGMDNDGLSTVVMAIANKLKTDRQANPQNIGRNTDGNGIGEALIIS